MDVSDDNNDKAARSQGMQKKRNDTEGTEVGYKCSPSMLVRLWPISVD